jgi:hypothetical protein
MTSLSKRKRRLIVETADVVRERGRLREVVIEATPHVALIRLKGTRTVYPISYAAIYSQAVKLEVAKLQAEKKGAKKGRR